MTPAPPPPPPPGPNPAVDSSAETCPESGPLVVLFGATAGALGPDLGSDETDLILLVWQVVEPRSRQVGWAEGGGVSGELQDPRAQGLIGSPRLSQVGTLHKSLVRAEAAALSPQCREASGLSADSLARAEPLDKVLQQVSARGAVGGDAAGPQVPCYAGEAAGGEAWRAGTNWPGR